MCAVQDNPTPLVILFSCIGARPQAEVSVEEVEFIRMLGDKQETKMIKVKNTGLMPFDFNVMDSWKLHPRDRARLPTVTTHQQTTAMMPVAWVTSSRSIPDRHRRARERGCDQRRVCRAGAAGGGPSEDFEHDLQIEVFDPEKFLGIEKTLMVKIKAEAYKILMTADYEDQPEDQPDGQEFHNFNEKLGEGGYMTCVRVGDAQTRKMTLTNTGKYECGFRFVLRKGMRRCSPSLPLTPKSETQKGRCQR